MNDTSRRPYVPTPDEEKAWAAYQIMADSQLNLMRLRETTAGMKVRLHLLRETIGATRRIAAASQHRGPPATEGSESEEPVSLRE
jgi:hypothetical protein